MNSKSFEEIMERLRSISIDEEFDLIVAIANGGILPASLLNQRLQARFHTLHLNLRDEFQQPKYNAPKLVRPIDFDFSGQRILLVDDRIKTGSTIRMARDLLQGAKTIRTFAVNGTADYALFNETCFRFPWIV